MDWLLRKTWPIPGFARHPCDKGSLSQDNPLGRSPVKKKLIHPDTTSRVASHLMNSGVWFSQPHSFPLGFFSYILKGAISPFFSGNISGFRVNPDPSSLISAFFWTPLSHLAFEQEMPRLQCLCQSHIQTIINKILWFFHSGWDLFTSQPAVAPLKLKAAYYYEFRWNTHSLVGISLKFQPAAVTQFIQFPLLTKSLVWRLGQAVVSNIKAQWIVQVQ